RRTEPEPEPARGRGAARRTVIVGRTVPSARERRRERRNARGQKD
ncbi:DUF948 domain-containing protein, partial [Streptomyces sp. SID7982]|nr:DUF948 domain-containing protein [Streptomyces sp. SID7982]